MECQPKRKNNKNNPTKTKASLKNIQDKGSAVVILDKTYNKTKFQEILKDETNNKLIDKNMDNNTILKMTKFCKMHHKSQTKKKEKDFLTNYISITSNFYGLPKIGCPRGVMVKAMNCGIVVREFVLQSHYYVHFRANTLGKGMNPLILPPAMGK